MATIGNWQQTPKAFCTVTALCRSQGSSEGRREGYDGDCRETRRLSERADGITKVSPDIVNPRKAAPIAIELGDVLHTAEIASRGCPRFVLRSPTTDVLRCQQLRCAPISSSRFASRCLRLNSARTRTARMRNLVIGAYS